MSRLTEKTEAWTLIICESNSLRQIFTEAIKAMGYVHVTYVTSGKDALRYLSTNVVDWVVTTFTVDADLNALALLDLILREKTLNHIRCSIIIDPEVDYPNLPLAFELGALSFHHKTYIVDEAIELMNGLASHLKNYNGDEILTAAEYIRLIIVQLGFTESLMALEQSLLSLYPGNKRIVFGLAEAFFIAGKPVAALAAVEQLKLLAPSMQEAINRLLKKYNAENVVQEAGASPNVLGVRNAAVIDPDTDVGKNIEDLLRAVGVQHVERFDSSEKACSWLGTDSKKPDLICMEWRQHEIAGAALVQRIRVDLECSCPIVVVSSLIKKEDASLVKEIGINGIVRKPFESQDFYTQIIRAIQEFKNPRLKTSYVFKIKALLKEQKSDDAKHLISQYAASDDADNATKLEIMAEYCYVLGDHMRAKDLVIKAMKENANSLNALNLLGKILLALKDFQAALSLFEKASHLSPKNIERLFNICDAKLMVDDTSGAEQALDAIKVIDETNPGISEFEVKVALEKGDVNLASAGFNNLDSSESIISYMNSRAIVLVRSERFKEAISLYTTALKSIPPKWDSLKSAIQYNMALAYARDNQLNLTLKSLQEIGAFFNESLKRKVESLIIRTQNALNKDEMLILSDRSDEVIPTISMSSGQHAFIKEICDNEMLQRRSFELGRGDLCCFLIFNCLEGIAPAAKKMHTIPIRFQKKVS